MNQPSPSYEIRASKKQWYLLSLYVQCPKCLLVGVSYGLGRCGNCKHYNPAQAEERIYAERMAKVWAEPNKPKS